MFLSTANRKIFDLNLTYNKAAIDKFLFLAHLAKGKVSFCHHLVSVNFSHFNLLL